MHPTHLLYTHASKRPKKLPHGELNPGRPRDRRKCYQLHHEEIYTYCSVLKGLYCLSYKTNVAWEKHGRRKCYQLHHEGILIWSEMFPTISGGMVTNWTSYSWYCAMSRSLSARYYTKKKKNADTRDRTGDLQIFSLTLSQLSYSGWYMSNRYEIKIIARGGFDPPTFRLWA